MKEIKIFKVKNNRNDEIYIVANNYIEAVNKLMEIEDVEMFIVTDINGFSIEMLYGYE